MAVQGDRIKRKLEARQRTGARVTFYLSEEVYEAFKIHCGTLKPSAVVNELLKEFIATTPGPHKAEYKKLIDSDG